ncbi:MAG: hypothetical protein ACTJFI_00125 [Enterococcus viikkiensis]
MTNMQEQPFTAKQLFSLKPQTLEKRITLYYQVSKNKNCVIKLVRVLQIRDQLGTEALETPCRELIRTLYIDAPTSSMRRYFYYFRAYFSVAEWALLLLQMFSQHPVFRHWKQVVRIQKIYRERRYYGTVP